MSERKARKAMVRWEAATRSWGVKAGRRLVLDLYHQRTVAPAPYTVGVVLWQDERTLVEAPARCSADQPPIYRIDKHNPFPEPPITRWLATDQRIVGRLSTGVIYGHPWTSIVGCRVDLAPGREWLQLDLHGAEPVVWKGPGIAPLAVVAVWHLHGPQAMIEHPGLAVLRQVPDDAASRITQAAPALEAGLGR